MKIDLSDINSYRRIFNIDDKIPAFLYKPCYDLQLPLFERNKKFTNPFLYITPNFACLQIYKYTDYTYIVHNVNGPASITFDDDGTITSIVYYVNNIQHNSYGPSYISFDSDGNKNRITYRVNGKLHNTVGPAVISYYEGKFGSAHFYINNRYISKDDFFERKNENIYNNTNI